MANGNVYKYTFNVVQFRAQTAEKYVSLYGGTFMKEKSVRDYEAQLFSAQSTTVPNTGPFLEFMAGF